jgi:hypothetical protein
MADHEDENMERLWVEINNTYAVMCAVCEDLPLPIALPDGPVTPEGVLPAVRRMAALAPDQPMPELYQALLHKSGVMWCAAMDLAMLLGEDYDAVRVMGADYFQVLAMAALAQLAEWLNGEGAGATGEPDDEPEPERDEKVMAELWQAIGYAYFRLGEACLALPLRIELPTGLVTSRYDMRPSVQRVMETTSEQPLPDDQRALLRLAALHWLTALDAFTMLAQAEYHVTRVAAVEHALASSVAATEQLTSWLRENEPREE